MRASKRRLLGVFILAPLFKKKSVRGLGCASYFGREYPKTEASQGKDGASYYLTGAAEIC
jgi:hypothetical protein